MQERVPRPETVTVTFTLNGQTATAVAAPFASLADTLRQELGLTGTKIGCEAGDCGACTVLLDGEQVCACLIATAQANGTRIDTVEGAGPRGLTNRLRTAFLAHGAAQCGICTPGMLMAAADLLARAPSPDRGEVEDAIGGVLCRCTGYLKIVEAILDAGAGLGAELAEGHVSRAVLRQAQDGDGGRGDATFTPVVSPSNHGKVGVLRQAQDCGSSHLLSAEPVAAQTVGARLPRVDGWAKVAGTDRFGADEAPAGALWMRVVRSPHARARFTLGDLATVKARTPELAAILTAKDVPGENRFGVFPNTKDQPVLAEDAVRFRGEAVLALVGTRQAVESISDADLPITWTPETPLSSIDDALAPATPAIHVGIPDNVLTRGNLACGDVGASHARAAATAEGCFDTQFVEHAYIEPEAGHAVPVGAGRDLAPARIEISACTQAPYMDLEETARVLGVSPSRVRIRPTACGGGFGGKLDVSVQPLLAVAAWVTRRPVRIVYTRTESMSSTTKRHPARIWAK